MSSREPQRPVAVLGATGGIGSAVVAEFAAHGRPVRAISRSGRVVEDAATVTPLAVDVTDDDALALAVDGCEYVVHAAAPPYPQWSRVLPAITRAVLRAAARVGARLVVADNLYAYGPHDGPLTEQLPAAATTGKGRLRASIAADLLAAHTAGSVQVVLGRASDYYGPHGLTSHGGERLFAAALAGRPLRLVGRLDVPHTWSYLPDVGRALVALAERHDAYGRAWHLPAAEPLTGRQFLTAVAAAAGTGSRIGSVPTAVLRAGGLVDPVLRELPEMLYQFRQPFVVDDSAFRTHVADLEPTLHDRAIPATLQWFRGRPRGDSGADD